MAFPPFSKKLAVRVIEDDTDIPLLAKITTDEDERLKFIRVFFYMAGVPGTERIKAVLHTSQNTNREYATSNWVSFSEIHEGDHTLSWTRFDFDEEDMLTNFDYYLSVKTDGYSRNESYFYISLVYDYPITTNLNVTATDIFDYPKAFQLFGKT